MKKKVLILSISLFLVLVISFLFFYSFCLNVQSFPKFDKEGISFIVVNDMGRLGYYEQKPIANLIGKFAEENDIKFVAVAGDPHHYMGVQSVCDPLWMTNFESIYNHPELQIPWNVVLGNHEYRGNTQAILDYTNISRRWNAPARYFLQNEMTKSGEKCLFVYIDTTPLIYKYRKDKEDYPDAYKQNMQSEINWIDSVLTMSNAKWKFVIGHHPVYAYTLKDENECIDMQQSIGDILEKNNVDAYICGHIHSFQHIKPADKKVNYIVNSSASQSRAVKKTEGTIFCSPDPGFSVFSVTSERTSIYFINQKGKTIYEYTINK